MYVIKSRAPSQSTGTKMTNQLGCYGSVLYHDADSRRCQACPFLDQCKIEVATNSIALRDWYESLVSNKDKATTKARKRAIQILAPEARVKRAASVPAVASTTTATKKQRDLAAC
ncbi:5'-3' exonuclease [Xanthomonas phage JGB6]|nr:5'-3' exonuclease [Xanthomonas phage JGB6]